MIRNLLLSQLQSAARTEKRVAKAIFRKRFQKIVESVRLKCLQCIAIIGGHKDGDRHCMFSYGADYIKTVELRELNIEEHQVGFLLANRSDCGLAIAAFAGNLKFRKRFQVFPNAAPGQRLVIDHESFILHGLPAFDARTSVMSPVAGKLNFTATPPPSRLAISKECWLL